MAVTGVENDTRGWILCIASGIGKRPAASHGSRLTQTPACCFGATIICIDVFVRQFPGQKSFRIQDSNVFLACSLSLSFGVMVGFDVLPEPLSRLTVA